MRGRTLNHSFVILDEAQNTTPEQDEDVPYPNRVRLQAVVTGDITQIDLARGQKSGMVAAQRILADVRGIAFSSFKSDDVVRHPLVQSIVTPTNARGRISAVPEPRLRSIFRLGRAQSVHPRRRRCAAGPRRLWESRRITVRIVGSTEARRLESPLPWREPRDQCAQFSLRALSRRGAGDIVLCVRSSRARPFPGQDAGGAFAHLVIHGALHLQGYETLAAARCATHGASKRGS